jgi:hypothetical protein
MKDWIIHYGRLFILGILNVPSIVATIIRYPRTSVYEIKWLFYDHSNLIGTLPFSLLIYVIVGIIIFLVSKVL